MKEIEKPLKSDNMAENVGVWDAEFIDLDDATLYKLVTAANYLMIQSLLDLAYPMTDRFRIPSFRHVLRSLRTSKERKHRRFASVSTFRVISHQKKRKEYVLSVFWDCRYDKTTNGLMNCFVFSTNNPNHVFRRSRRDPLHRSTTPASNPLVLLNILYIRTFPLSHNC